VPFFAALQQFLFSLSFLLEFVCRLQEVNLRIQLWGSHSPARR